MIGAEELAALEQAFPVLRAVPPGLRPALAGEAIRLEARAGETLLDFDSSVPGSVMLTSGTIRAVTVGKGGREILLYRVGPGEACILTTTCTLGRASFPARGIADTDVDGSILPPPLFSRLLLEAPGFATFVFESYAQRVAELIGLVHEVAFHRLDQRLASLLLQKGEVVTATHQKLADELGSVREIVSRLLKGFEEQGAVELGRGRLRIRDAAWLQRVAEV